MYTYHLWIILRESTTEADVGSLGKKLTELKTRVSTLLQPVPDIVVTALNHEYIFQCSESHNHKGDVHERLLKVIEWLTKALSGSYGLIYWYDDEMQGVNRHNGYRVMVIARGRIEYRNDPFLSPVVPVIED